MKPLLALAALVLFASPAHADSISLGSGAGSALLIFPTGSTITGEFTVANAGTGYPNQGIDFSLLDGTGNAQGQYDNGDFGQITFSLPVDNLVLTWIANSSGPSELWTNNGITGFSTSGEQTVSFANGVTYIQWTNGNEGYSGIESMTYTVDPVNAPEPSFLLAIGLAALAIKRKVE